MLDQFFSPFRGATNKGPLKNPKKTNSDDEKEKLKKAIEIKFHQEIVPHEISEIEEFPVVREYTHLDSSDYSLHRLGYYWPLQSIKIS
jgi:hypothetical protein